MDTARQFASAPELLDISQIPNVQIYFQTFRILQRIKDTYNVGENSVKTGYLIVIVFYRYLHVYNLWGI